MSVLPRWRLVLGRYADKHLSLNQGHARMDRALDYLYNREYQGRGLRKEIGPGSLDDSQLALVTWLGAVRELFPREAVEMIERHALDRYGLTELVTDPKTLEKLEPNQELLRNILALRGHMQGPVLEVARRLIRQVVDELRRKLETEIRHALSGRLNRFRHSPMAMAQNFDAAGTVRANLKHYDAERRQLVLEQLRFFERNARRLPWDIILCVDQSGSMADSVIHSAVMAGILSSLPAFRVKTRGVRHAGGRSVRARRGPVEVLMRVQLGGGTDIAKAVRYCSQLVQNPHRSVFVLVSDFCEGGSPRELVREVRKLAESRVRLLGLAALDGGAEPAYDRQMAQRLAGCGMEIAALTPQKLAHWLVKATS